MLVLFEIKKYILAYRRLLIGLLAAGLICFAVGAGASALAGRGSLFEPFAVGVVDNGSSPEIKFVFDFFDDAIELVYMGKDEAEQKLASGEVPAYVELPGRFAQDIMSGRNTPFVLHGNGKYVIQLALSKLLASGGVAFLSSSQAGIYATIDEARASGMAGADIDRYVVLPINVAFVKQLLDYNSLFSVQVLPLTEGTPWTHYVYSFAAFMLMLNLLSFVKTLRGYTPAVYARFNLAGVKFPAVQAVRLAGVITPHALLTVPLLYIASRNIAVALAAGLALAFCVGALGMMAAALFKNETGAGLFIFLTAIVMLFLAGGIVPAAYLPLGIHGLRYACIPFWAVQAANGHAAAAGALFAMGAAFLSVAYVKDKL